MSDDAPGLTDRVERLERAVAELTCRVAAAPPADDRTEEPDIAGGTADRFWALEGLKVRVGEPGAVLFTGSVWIGEGEHYEWQEARPTSDLLDQDWGDLAASVSAVAHPVRLTLLQEVVRGQSSVAALAQDERLGTSGQLYHHLRQLVAAGWLVQARRGSYRVPPARVIPLLVLMMAADR